MRKTLYALVLVLALSGSALAGDINNPPVAAPGAATDSPSADQSSDEETSDGLAEAALSVINSVLALL